LEFDELVSELETLRYLANRNKNGNGRIREIRHRLNVLARRVAGEGVNTSERSA